MCDVLDVDEQQPQSAWLATPVVAAQVGAGSGVLQNPTAPHTHLRSDVQLERSSYGLQVME